MLKRIAVMLALLLTGVTQAEPPSVYSVYAGEVDGCRKKEDATAVAQVAAMDANRSSELFWAKKLEAECGTYKGPFIVLELVEQHGRMWVVRVSTPIGQLYLFYNEPEPERTAI